MMTNINELLRKLDEGWTKPIATPPEFAEAARVIREQQNEIASLRQQLADAKVDAERFNWLFGGEWESHRWNHIYRIWDGSDGREGLIGVLDQAMKVSSETVRNEVTRESKDADA